MCNFFYIFNQITRSKHLVPIERSITRIIYLKYQNSTTCCGKVINKIKVFKKEGQTPRSQGK